MFIEKAFNFLHDSWRYIVGFIVVFLVWQFGSLPLMVAAVFKHVGDGGNFLDFEQDPNLVMTALDSNLTLFLMLLSFAIGLLMLFIWLKAVHRQPFQTITSVRPKMDWGRFAFGFSLIAIITISLTLVDYFSNPDDYVLQFDWSRFSILLLICVVMIPLQTGFEEWFFRGYMMQGIGVMARTKWAPLLFTSFLFGGLHFFNPEVDKLGNIIMLYYIGTGLFLGIITLMDDGLELALGFHTGNNLVGALLVTADWTAFKTDSIFKDVSDPSAGIDVLIPIFVLYPLLLALMAWRYKWTNWNTKLLGVIDPPLAKDNEDIVS